MIHIDKSVPIIHIKGNTVELLNDVNNVLCNIVASVCDDDEGKDRKITLQTYITAIYESACKVLEVDP